MLKFKGRGLKVEIERGISYLVRCCCCGRGCSGGGGVVLLGLVVFLVFHVFNETATHKQRMFERSRPSLEES